MHHHPFELHAYSTVVKNSILTSRLFTCLFTGGEYTVNTYEGHVFYCTNEQKTIEYARFLMTQDQVLYIVKDNKNPPPIHILEHRQKEEVFLKEYLNKTGMITNFVCFTHIYYLL